MTVRASSCDAIKFASTMAIACNRIFGFSAVTNSATDAFADNGCSTNNI